MIWMLVRTTEVVYDIDERAKEKRLGLSVKQRFSIPSRLVRPRLGEKVMNSGLQTSSSSSQPETTNGVYLQLCRNPPLIAQVID